jgi:hypothetical protein
MIGMSGARWADSTLDRLAAFVPTCRPLARLLELDLIGACG